MSVIPDAAVEVAAKCLPGYDPNWGGDETDRAENEALRSRARQILEAAAPHVAAQALADAVDAFPLETITAPDNAVVWLRRRAEGIRNTA